MLLKTLLAAGLATLTASAAQPLPELRIEPITGGSIFYVKNTGSLPVTGFMIELVNYPGSYYALWQDEYSAELISPGMEKEIQVTNMTVGAVPDYVKVQAAVFADGSTAGVPEKITAFVERRKAVLGAVRELIARVDKGASADDLKQWSESIAPARRASPTAQATINANAVRGTIGDAVRFWESHSKDETMVRLRGIEKVLAASKPGL